MSEMTHREEIEEMSYQIHRDATLLAFGVVGRGDALAQGSLWNKKEALEQRLNSIIVEKNNLTAELVYAKKLLRKAASKMNK